MAIRGQRFHINLDEDLDDGPAFGSPSGAKITAGPVLGIVRDIQERKTQLTSNPPLPPQLKSPETGFPKHRTRTSSSKFKTRKLNTSGKLSQLANLEEPAVDLSLQNEQKINSEDASARNGAASRHSLASKDPSIDQENKQRLAKMSDQEIEEAREELMAGLSPSLIQKLLRKANIDDKEIDSNTNLKIAEEASTENVRTAVTLGSSPPPEVEQTRISSWDPDGPPLHLPPDLHPASSFPSSLPQLPNLHFPKPPQPPDLDPSDPDFFAALHSTYFPTLPEDPSAMAWMTPLGNKAEEQSAYSPLENSHPVSALRFDFRGHLLPPRLSNQIPSTKGLHHHAHAPSSAGYTVPELSHLARSTYPAQRCLAYQTLGRILYRLGRGDFGREGEDLCEGLWQLLEQDKVVDQLIEAATKEESSHRSVRVIAIEAVWLWRKGGGRRWRGR